MKTCRKVLNFKETIIMNWPVIIGVGILLIALVVFLIRRNMKDEEEFEHQVKEDYHKPKPTESDIEIDEKIQ